MPIWVKSYFKAGGMVKGYTKATAKHRLFTKLMNKGTYQKRAIKAGRRTGFEMVEGNATPKRYRSLQKRMTVIKRFMPKVKLLPTGRGY